MDVNDYLIIWIGAKLRELRKAKGWNLSEFSEKSDISIAMLSKIENGRVFPTFPSLLQILNVLEVDLNEFFNDLQVNNKFPGYIFKKRNEYQAIHKEESEGFNYEVVFAHTVNHFSIEVSMLTLNKGAQREKVSTEGYEFIFLIKGEIQFELGENTFELREGDSLFFDGRLAHVPHNRLDTDAVLLVMYFITQIQ
ncbi:XRE family transcriptional regulator [Rapidithrix thailandica]|uniref:XRE family transcriptional regulator n=1 Tax=Rapidithrix thailandica TaxID=413964 RepID=A0AAW9SCW2_9BACT